MYKLTNTDSLTYSVIRLSDGACIPFARDNIDYIQYQEWLAEGNTPAPAFTDQELQAQVQASIVTAIESMLDTKAKELRYDNIMSARSYAGYTNPFQSEALRLADWSAACWATAGHIEYDVSIGARTAPTLEQALSEMPVFV